MLGTLGDLQGTSQGSRVLAGLNDAVDKELLKKICMMNWLKMLMPLIDSSGIVRKADYNTNINEIKGKYEVLLA